MLILHAKYILKTIMETKIADTVDTTENYKEKLIAAAKIALTHLLVVIEEPIITYTEDDVSSDRLKNSVQTKKIAVFDYLDILTRIDAEQLSLTEGTLSHSSQGFAERNSKGR